MGLAALIIIVAVLCSGPAMAQDKAHTYHLRYEIYAGGFNAVESHLYMQKTPEDYDIYLGVKTKGFLGWIVPWKGSFETEGAYVKADAMEPSMHRSTATWRGDTEIKTYSYGEDGEFTGLTITEEGEDKSPDSIDEELTKNTTDVLTATLQVMQDIAGGQPCEGAEEVFDGKRRYEIVFKAQSDTVLESNRYNMYEGPAVSCTVEVNPKGGEWHKKPRGWLSVQEQGRERGFLPQLWFADVVDEKDFPAMPVKLRAKTEYGTFFMHLASIEEIPGLPDIPGDLALKEFED